MIASAYCRDAGHDAGLLGECKKPRLFSPQCTVLATRGPRGEKPFLGSTSLCAETDSKCIAYCPRAPAHTRFGIVDPASEFNLNQCIPRCIPKESSIQEILDKNGCGSSRKWWIIFANVHAPSSSGVDAVSKMTRQGLEGANGT